MFYVDYYHKLKAILSPILLKAGLKEVSEELHPESFGSVLSVFSGHRKQMRIVWDGKDGWGFAQFLELKDTKDWQDIPIYLTKYDLDDSEISRQKIDQVRVAIEEIIVGTHK